MSTRNVFVLIYFCIHVLALRADPPLPLVWNTGGNTPWVTQTSTTHDGVAAFQSGAIVDFQQSWTETSVTGPGILSYWWKVSSEASYDLLTISYDGLIVNEISGEVDWVQRTLVIGTGIHTIRWTYSKDVVDQGGKDSAWLDDVNYIPEAILTKPPEILTQPIATAVNANSIATFSVAGSGSNLSYQWRKNLVNIVGATSSTLVLNNVQTNQAGLYSVVISNSYGNVTSGGAMLQVNRLAQTIIFGSLSVQQLNASPITLTASSNSKLPITYVSSLLSVAKISGATVTILALGTTTITASQPGDAVYLPANSISQKLIVAVPPPIITSQPASITVNVTSNATFKVTASGSAPLSYQWRLGGVNISGATKPTLDLLNVASKNAGKYSVRVTNPGGSIDSVEAQLTVTLPSVAPTIVAQPMNQSVNQGVSVTLAVTATGTAPLTYQWLKNGTPVIGATSATLKYDNVAPNTAGSYSVVVSNTSGKITSKAAVLTVSAKLVAPTITTAPRGETVTVGATTTLSVIASGSQPLSYQWLKNGKAISGAISSTLIIKPAALLDSGTYSVTVSNAAGNVTSTAITLLVIAPSTGENTWTILVYGHGDHNLSQSLVVDMLEMEKVGSASGFNIVVQSDFDSSKPAYSGLPNALKSGVTRFLIKTNATGELRSPAVQRLPELNLDLPVNVTDFVKWGIANYPAKRFGLVFWNHGGQWEGGFGHDGQDGTDGSSSGIRTAPLKNAVKAAMQGTSVQKFDFVAFDTCLMGGAEILGDMAELSDILIAGPELDFGDGWDYTASLKMLKENPGISARNFAAAEVKHWEQHHFYSGYEADKMFGFHAAYDLTSYAKFKTAFFAFGPLLGEFVKANPSKYMDIRRKSTPYSVGSAAEAATALTYVDLGELAQRIAAESVSSAAFKGAAQSLIGSITNMIVGVARGTSKLNAIGLSVYLPVDGKIASGYSDLSLFADNPSWINLLSTTSAARSSDTSGPTLTGTTDGKPRSANRNTPAQLTFQVNDTTDIHRVSGYLISDTFTDDPDEWVYLGQLFSTNGLTSLDGNFEWNGTAPVIWGADYNIGLYLGGFIDPTEPNIMTSYAEYLPPANDESQYVILLTDMSGDNPRLISVLDWNDDSDMAPRAVELEPGGLLTPIYYVEYLALDDPDTFEVYSILAFDSLLIPAEGIAGMEVAWAYMPTDDYIISLEAEDNFGNVSETIQFIVTVEEEPMTVQGTLLADGSIEIWWYDPYFDTILETTTSLNDPVVGEEISEDFIDFDGEMRFYNFFPEEKMRYFRIAR